MSFKVHNNPKSPDFFPVHLYPYDRAPELVPQHHHPDEFEWFFCTRGGGIQVVNQWKHRVAEGDLIVIPPGIPHVFCADPSGCDCQVLMISANWFEGSGAIMNEARYVLNFWKNYTQTHGFYADFPKEEIQRIRVSLEGRQGIGLCAAVFSLLELAFKLPYPLERPEYRERDLAIREVLYYLNDHFSEKISIADVLRISGLSRSSFHRRFFKTVGMTFCRYLNRLRLNAIEWMAASGMSRESAAFHCGFSSRSNYYQQRRLELEEKNSSL